ncbi:hypothetical protein [Paenibacillus sp. YSY-4.3]
MPEKWQVENRRLSFQALDFYKKEGFEIYGMIEKAERHTHYYMKKVLQGV